MASKIKNFIGHFKTITHHKNLVMIMCFRAGLYKQGLLHDLSKYSITEFRTGIKYYNGKMSPNGIEKKKEGVSKAWLHHKGRNKHHSEYWLDFGTDPSKGFQGMEMPVKYVAEMFIDRICACKNYQKDKYTDKSPWEYYDTRRQYNIIHPKSKRLLEALLKMLYVYGEDYTIKYIKKNIVKNYKEEKLDELEKQLEESGEL